MTNALQKRLEVLEKRKQHQPDFVPARWMTRAEAAVLYKEKYEKEEASGFDFEADIARQRAAGTPEWMINCQRDQRETYYRKKLKNKATDTY